jgi:hypothetical protein
MNEEDLQQLEQIQTAAKEITPVSLIEHSLSKFLNDTFVMVREEDDYQKSIKAEVIKRLPDLKPSELIALATSATTNKNDAISKVIAPTMQLLTAAQQNEMASKQKDIQAHSINQTNIREINNTAPSDVLNGLQALFNLANATKEKQLADATSVNQIQDDPLTK